MRVEVVFALPQRADRVSVELPAGATVREALSAAGWGSTNAVGIFGKRVTLDQPLADGDRVEIYRPLAVDPKEARRLRAKKKK